MLMVDHVSGIADVNNPETVVSNPDDIKTHVVYISEVNEFFRPRVYDEPRIDRTNSLEWVQKSIELLEEMLSISRDRTMTVKRWADANIQCGDCFRGFHAWFGANPIDDDWEAWLDRAEAEIRENGWV